MVQFVDHMDLEILPDLQGDAAVQMRLLLAHSEGTIDDQKYSKLLLINVATDEDSKGKS